jgi:hypothetical protein
MVLRIKIQQPINPKITVSIILIPLQIRFRKITFLYLIFENNAFPAYSPIPFGVKVRPLMRQELRRPKILYG